MSQHNNESIEKDRILLVDDEKDFTQALAKRMKARGLEVETVECGEQAIKMAQGKPFTAIVLDLKMSGMDGIQTMKELMTIDPDLQIILLTGHGTIPKSVEAMKQGAIDFLEKPADFDELLAKINEAKARKMVLVQKRTEEKIADILNKKHW